MSDDLLKLLVLNLPNFLGLLLLAYQQFKIISLLMTIIDNCYDSKSGQKLESGSNKNNGSRA